MFSLRGLAGKASWLALLFGVKDSILKDSSSRLQIFGTLGDFHTLPLVLSSPGPVIDLLLDLVQLLLQFIELSLRLGTAPLVVFFGGLVFRALQVQQLQRVLTTSIPSLLGRASEAYLAMLQLWLGCVPSFLSFLGKFDGLSVRHVTLLLLVSNNFKLLLQIRNSLFTDLGYVSTIGSSSKRQAVPAS